MATIYQYTPEEVQLIVAGVPIHGFADGTFITFEWAEDLYTTVVSADGEVSRARSANRSGTMTVTLKQTSDSNAVFEGLAALDVMSNKGVFTLSLLDSSNTEIFSASAWIQKPAGLTLSKGIENREWVIAIGRVYTIVTPKMGSTQSAVEKLSHMVEDVF